MVSAKARRIKLFRDSPVFLVCVIMGQDANVLNDYYDAFRKAYAEMENREMKDKIVSRHSISLPSQENTI